MRIKTISVTNLFGIFNHTIPLNLEDRITVIFGPNGFGKTFVLTLINALFKGSWPDFFRVPFDTMTLDFEDESVVTVDKIINDREEILSIKYKESKGLLRNLEIKKYNDKKNGYDFIDNTKNDWASEVPLNEEPRWFRDLRNSIRIIFINTQRLIHLSDARHSETVESVTDYRNQLKQEIEKKLAEYATLSQSLDRTFLIRLAKNNTEEDLSQEELRNRIKTLEIKRAKLVETGLIDRQDINTEDIMNLLEKKKDVLNVYLEDTEKKLAVMEGMASRLKILTDVVNDRFLNKKIEINKTDGFIFRMSNGETIYPENLSSGEQHMIVLLYELLFRIKKDSLILIDEPELSLHILWQQQFIRDMENIIGLVGFDTVIATHSPQIIHDRWDLAVELKATC